MAINTNILAFLSFLSIFLAHLIYNVYICKILENVKRILYIIVTKKQKRITKDTYTQVNEFK
jgi:hypothetical protein